MRTIYQTKLSAAFISASLLLLAAGCATPGHQTGDPQPDTSPHQGFFERGPRASVVGEHGTYNIAWLTITDQILLQKPVYEVLVTYHSPRRGAGAVTEKHWREMQQVAQDEIIRRCPAPAQAEVLRSMRDYDSGNRAAGAELRVDYSCR